MTVTRYTNYLAMGQAADTKPNAMAVDSIYIERDTGKFFKKTGATTWVQLFLPVPALGTQYQVLRVNSGATASEWASLTTENTGIATANGNGSATVFNIAHSIGSTPSVYSASCMSLTTTYTYTADATNIVVTFTTAPPSGTGNVKIYWRAIA